MKIKYLLLIGILCIGFNKKSFGQDIRFGITANPGLVWVKPDNPNISSDGIRFGFDFGLVVDYVFGSEERYAINTGVNMFLSGARIMGSNPLTDSTSELTAKINYLEIPITIKLRSNEMGHLTFYGQMGIANQIAVRSRADLTLKDGAGTVLSEIKNSKFKDIEALPNSIKKVKPYNLGLIVEAGLEYDITENTILVGGLFFNAGFLDMFKDNDNERIVSRHMGMRISVLF